MNPAAVAAAETEIPVETKGAGAAPAKPGAEITLFALPVRSNLCFALDGSSTWKFYLEEMSTSSSRNAFRTVRGNSSNRHFA